MQPQCCVAGRVCVCCVCCVYICVQLAPCVSYVGAVDPEVSPCPCYFGDVSRAKSLHVRQRPENGEWHDEQADEAAAAHEAERYDGAVAANGNLRRRRKGRGVVSPHTTWTEARNLGFQGGRG